MRLFGHRIPTTGRFWTRVAAGLLVVTAAVPNLWPGAFGIGHHGRGPWQGQFLGALLMAGALLDRWRLVRWLLILGALPPLVWSLAARHATPGWIFVDVASLALFLILISSPVSRYFRRRAGDWDEDEEEDGAEGVLPPAQEWMLPPETIDPGFPGHSRRDSEEAVRDRSAPRP